MKLINRIFSTLATATLLSFVPNLSSASDALAIAVGLNSVNPSHYGGWRGDLLACENDARDMLAVAKTQGFQTLPLLTKQATKSALRKALAEAAQKLKSGDILVLSYSGHGGQVADANGDEADGLDETWCLYDGEIVDDEVAQMWSKFQDGVRIAVYSDSCHSGTIIKTYDEEMRKIAEERRYRYIPEDIQKKVMALDENKEFGRSLQSEKDSKGATKAAVILISGCEDEQLSMDGDKNGRFTEEVLKVWNSGAFSGSYRTFHQAIRAAMPPDQKPNFDVYGQSNPTFEAQKPWSK